MNILRSTSFFLHTLCHLRCSIFTGHDHGWRHGCLGGIRPCRNSDRRAESGGTGDRCSRVCEHVIFRREAGAYYERRALEYERLFLGLLYKFMVMNPRASTRRAPSHVCFILNFLSQRVQDSRHCSCTTSTCSSATAMGTWTHRPDP